MKLVSSLVIFVTAFLAVCLGKYIGNLEILKIITKITYLTKADSPCGDWEPYKDLKCFKVANKLGTFADAEKACHDLDSSAQLISIASHEEQQFVQNFLFVKSKLLDNVWIGAKNVAGKFLWSHGAESLTFT